MICGGVVLELPVPCLCLLTRASSSDPPKGLDQLEFPKIQSRSQLHLRISTLPLRHSEIHHWFSFTYQHVPLSRPLIYNRTWLQLPLNRPGTSHTKCSWQVIWNNRNGWGSLLCTVPSWNNVLHAAVFPEPARGEGDLTASSGLHRYPHHIAYSHRYININIKSLTKYKY